VTHIFTATDVGADLQNMRFGADTSDVMFFDDAMADFVHQATDFKLSSSIFTLRGHTFPGLVPKTLRNTPVWLVWLYEEVHADGLPLSCTYPTVDLHTSTDLLKRRMVLAWNVGARSYCASALSMNHHLNACLNENLLMFVVSPRRFSAHPWSLDDELANQLNEIGPRCGSDYNPLEHHSTEALSHALVKSVFLGNEPKTDPSGRELILLKHRVWNRY
jgi:hypothetical protein